MRKLIALMLALGCADSAVLAGPMGLVRPSSDRWGLEFEGSLSRRVFTYDANKADEYRADNILYLTHISYGINDNIELSVRLGTDAMELIDLVDVKPRDSIFFGSNEFAWGVGIGTILYDGGMANLACQATWLDHSNHEGIVIPSGFTSDVFDCTEWQVGLQVQGQSGRFLPYFGVIYSDAQIKNNAAHRSSFGPSRNVAHAEQNVGAYGGALFDLSSHLSLYIEARAIDEESYGAGLRYSWGGRNRSSPKPSLVVTSNTPAPVRALEPAGPTRTEPSAAQDALYLNDGSILRGRITDEKAYAITIDVAGTFNEIPMLRINRVVRGGR